MIGAVLLAHEHLARTRQLAAHLTAQGFAVALHVDVRAPREDWTRLRNALSTDPLIRLLPRRASEWGMFDLVDVSLDGLRVLLADFPELTHIVHLSGACLPIRPLAELQAHLAAHPDTDFIEAKPLDSARWVGGGLSGERLTLYHPVSWKRHRRVFDASVEIQRRLGVRRRPPEGLEPRIGSQWWCLSRGTAQAILDDPQRAQFDRFFRTTWIPDESYFQTLAARHARTLVDAPLTFMRFDPQGKPHLFYDDHVDLLLHTDAFFARKIWHGADRLYDLFLGQGLSALQPAERDPVGMTRRLDRARNIRVLGRQGLVAQGRHPARQVEAQYATARSYTVFDGFRDLFPGLNAALNVDDRLRAHGRLFAPDRAEFFDGAATFEGNIPDTARIRDGRPQHFLVNVIWADRVRSQFFHHDFPGTSLIDPFIRNDPNAQIIRLDDLWLLDLFRRTPVPSQSEIGAALDRDANRIEAEDIADLACDFMTLSLAEILQVPRAAARRIRAATQPYVDVLPALAAPRFPPGFSGFVRDVSRTPRARARLGPLADLLEDRGPEQAVDQPEPQPGT